MKSYSKNNVVIAALLYASSIQYFIVQIIVQHYWLTPYSLKFNYISDLGNTDCGSYSGRFVCSPDYHLMNFSFILLAVTMIVGSLLLINKYKSVKKQTVAFYLLAISGFGTLLVGLFPENTVAQLHGFGAFLIFLLGNVALLFFGHYHKKPGWLRFYSLLSGVVGLLALFLFVNKTYLGFGVGGIERFVAYPQTIWMIIFGIYLLTKSQKTSRKLK